METSARFSFFPRLCFATLPERRLTAERMHPSSYDKMAAFRRDYLSTREAEALTILDLGSQDINGSYRPLFAAPAWHYLGVDMAPGHNVDLVLQDPYEWNEIVPDSIDVVISGQTFEHTEFFWLTMQQIARALNPVDCAASSCLPVDRSIASRSTAGAFIQMAYARSRAMPA